MKAKQKNSKKRLDDFEHDPLEEELDFKDLVTVAVGPGWALVPKHLRSPKHLREARAWLRKHASTKTDPATNQKKSPEQFNDDDVPLAAELDFSKLKRVGLGPGWALVPKHLRSPKHLREARAWLRKNTATKPSPATKPRRRVA